MKQFNITSDRFDGAVVCEYDTEGLMVRFEVETGVTRNNKAHRWLLERIPLHVNDIEVIRAQKALTITEIEPDLSFDRWFKLYNYAVSRKRAEQLWNKMSKSDRALALQDTPIYEKWRLSKGYDKAFPDTYLRQRKFTDQRGGI